MADASAFPWKPLATTPHGVRFFLPDIMADLLYECVRKWLFTKQLSARELGGTSLCSDWIDHAGKTKAGGSVLLDCVASQIGLYL